MRGKKPGQSPIEREKRKRFFISLCSKHKIGESPFSAYKEQWHNVIRDYSIFEELTGKYFKYFIFTNLYNFLFSTVTQACKMLNAALVQLRDEGLKNKYIEDLGPWRKDYLTKDGQPVFKKGRKSEFN